MSEPTMTRPLTLRQFQIAQCIAEDMTNVEIADELGISVHTVKNHLASVFGRIGVRSRVGLAMMVKEHGRVLMTAPLDSDTERFETSSQVVYVTCRQYEVGQLLASGLTLPEIANQLFLTEQTLNNHLTALYNSLGIGGKHSYQKRVTAIWLLVTGRVQLAIREIDSTNDETPPAWLDFTALIFPDEDPEFERSRLLGAFEQYLDRRLKTLGSKRV